MKHAALLSLACLLPLKAAEPYGETFRPQFHFTPRRGWIGDPNGLFRYRGDYHVFWWGHAVSRDLVRWKQLPHPMQGGDGSFRYFSGSVTVDEKNTSGFGDGKNPPMVAIYTAHKRDSEDQRMSVSRDYQNFQYHGTVLAPRTPSERDPDVFWHAPSQRWVMLTAVPAEKKIRLYASHDLKTWECVSDFSPPGAREGDWEVPNLFELAVEGGGSRWVLIHGTGPNKTFYFTGNFDGRTFTPDQNEARLVDAGSDFYAARAFRDLDNGGKVSSWIAWMGNWKYANHTPTTWGRGALSIPREIRLVKSPGGPRLVQAPLAALRSLRGEAVMLPAGDFHERKLTPERNTYELEAEFSTSAGAKAFGIELCSGPAQRVRLGYDPASAKLFLDRRESGNTAFHPEFPRVDEARLATKNGRVKLRVFVDQSSIEVFANDGEVVMTSVIFPDPAGREIRLFSDSAACRLESFTLWPLASIWETEVVR